MYSLRCRRRLSVDLRELGVKAGPVRRTRRPHRQRRPRHARVIKRSDAHEYQMRPRFSFAEEWSPARPAEPPTHTASARGDTKVLCRFSGRGEGGSAKARVHSSAACAKVLAVSAPTHSSHHGQLRTCPLNRTAEASTGYRHRVARPVKASRMIAGRFEASKLSANGACLRSPLVSNVGFQRHRPCTRLS